ncbi:MAG TPA: DNA ligase D [Acidobacteriaceae bacterium]|jgi:bifunctional non-homologous end joining protein LigD|nr:DNA ligase D [Acidobacteriaceae bacterium]
MPKRAAKSAASRTTPSQEVDRQLARYRSMRNFAATAEPRGQAASSHKVSALPFVIQKHAATRLHYDFRLGWRGVLKSWAVAKGPSYNPADKRLAVEVEDHPIDYGGFEGAIPKGQYGGGTVMVWDQGTWEPLVNVDEGLRDGNLKFVLHGQKLQGRWVLVRMHGDRFGRSDKPNWLLIKEKDEYARGPEDPAITDESPDSAVTGRTLDQIAEAADHVWNSNHPEKPTQKPPANRARLAGKSTAQAALDSTKASPDTKSLLHDAPKERFPGFLAPELAVAVTEPPQGDAWLHELKLDGYRIQIHIDQHRGRRRARLFTRRGLDWTHRMPAVAEAAAQLPVHAAILDGEVVVLNAQGGTSFADLQAAFEEGAQHPLTYFAFDLLHLDGHNLRSLPLERRKSILESLLPHNAADATLRYSSHIRAQGAEMFQRACTLGAEGVVSKLASEPYRSARSRDWLKSKCVLQQEFVVGGFTPLSSGSHGVGALLLGYYRDGHLIYAGRSGTGFTRKTHQLLRDRLDKLRQAKSPFHHPPSEAKKDAVWVKPELVIEARFATWTAGHLVRQAAFLGLREDKSPKEIVREQAGPAPRSARRQQMAEPVPKPSKKAPAKSASHAAKPAIAAARSAAHADPADVEGVRLTHPDKILDEESRLTKQQLAEYYAAVADHILPHIAGRPLSIVRCPEGTTQPCFFQKHTGFGVPAGIDSVSVSAKNGGKPEQYLTISKAEGLIALAQMGVLEIHPWGSRNDSLETPDRLIIDLDPDPALPWSQLVASAIEVRGLMKNLGLESFVKSTGGKGLHVVAPIQPDHEWPAIKTFAHNFVLMMEHAHPRLYLTKMTKSARSGKIFLDYLRNERGATAVAPFSPRARAGARVAMPLTWAGLQRTGPSHFDPKQFAVTNFSEWKSRLKRDPWQDMNSVKQRLTDKAIAAVAEMASQKSA